MSGNPVTPVRPIAIIGGTGPAGTGLALRWARAGENVIIGSRNEERAQQTAQAIQRKAGANANVAGLENSSACSAADILVLTVPFEGQAPLLRQLKPSITEGSILIDATVPLAAAVGGRASRPLGVWQGSAAQQAAELVPKGVSVVAAFHNLSADLLNGDVPLECDVIVCSDNPGSTPDRWRQARECAHRGTNHRFAGRPQHSPQRSLWHPNHRSATFFVSLSAIAQEHLFERKPECGCCAAISQRHQAFLSQHPHASACSRLGEQTAPVQDLSHPRGHATSARLSRHKETDTRGYREYRIARRRYHS